MARSILYCAHFVPRCLVQIPHCAFTQQTRPAATAQASKLRRRPFRRIHTTPACLLQSRPPKSRDRGPKSDEDTQTDFSALDVLRNTAAPATSIDACTGDGFALNNQMRISGSGLLLVGGEAFRWRPWLRRGRNEGATGRDAMMGSLLNAKRQWHVREEAWGALELVYPKPGMLHALLSRDLESEQQLTSHRSSHHRHRPSRHAHCTRSAHIPQRSRHKA